MASSIAPSKLDQILKSLGKQQTVRESIESHRAFEQKDTVVCFIMNELFLLELPITLGNGSPTNKNKDSSLVHNLLAKRLGFLTAPSSGKELETFYQVCKGALNHKHLLLCFPSEPMTCEVLQNIAREVLAFQDWCKLVGLEPAGILIK